MAIENGHGSSLNVTEEENNINSDSDTVAKNVDGGKETEPLSDTKDDDTGTTSKVESSAEIDESAHKNDEKDNKTEISSSKEETAEKPEKVDNSNEKSGRPVRSTRRISNESANTTTVKIKEEPSEVVLIDSEDEKDEKPKIKSTPARNVQSRNVKPPVRYNNNSNSKNSDFQIVSVDDDSPMNKNDPMNVFLCSTEEREFRKDYFKDPSSNVLKQRLHCTICDIHIGACPQNSKNMVCHRALKVLICRKCANFYGQGEFPQDEGSDEFCRWCGEGGEVFLCNSCSNVFCQACILRNFGINEVKRVDKLENWDCYVCDTRPLWTLRAIAFALFTYVRRIKVVAYRNGMYQSISSASAKVSKADLMALETDLSTCCPKEVKAAAAAASVTGVEPEKQNVVVANAIKPKDNKINQPSTSRTPLNKTPTPSNYQQSPRTSKRTKQPPKQMNTSWQQQQQQQQQMVSFGMSSSSVMYPQQSTLRSALVNQPQGFSNSFGNQNQMMMFAGSSSAGSTDGKEPNVLNWFNGILVSLMETMKNIDNRLVFIRNSTTNLISQNEVSFLVNQLHNLLKVSCSKMQEVDCDLLKNYKEFIDKSEISVNDFDDIVREFPEFFKPPENNAEPPEDSVREASPEPHEDFNPLALVEVIDEDKETPSSSKGGMSVPKPSLSILKKEKSDTVERNIQVKNVNSLKRKADDSIDDPSSSKVGKIENLAIKQEVNEHGDDDNNDNSALNKCSVDNANFSVEANS